MLSSASPAVLWIISSIGCMDYEMYKNPLHEHSLLKVVLINCSFYSGLGLILDSRV